jgi:hypothetical protein
MRKRAFLAVIAAVAVAGCARERPPGASPPEPAFEGPNAFDVIKVCRFSDEHGPVYFAHALHADLTDVAGKRITCVRCHHDLEASEVSVPRGCAGCHLPHEHAGESKVPST